MMMTIQSLLELRSIFKIKKLENNIPRMLCRCVYTAVWVSVCDNILITMAIQCIHIYNNWLDDKGEVEETTQLIGETI